MKNKISTYLQVEMTTKQLLDENQCVVKYLVSQGVDVASFACPPTKLVHADNEDSVIWASRNGHLDVVKFLVSQGADIRADNDWAVRWTCKNGHLDVVKYLVSQGADIRAENYYAVRWASQNGHLNVVKYLVSQGADIRAENYYAVRWASRNGHLDVVKYLVSQGADVASEACPADTLASVASEARPKLRFGACPPTKLVRAENYYAVRWASLHGHLDVVKYLVSQGADIRALNDDAVRWASRNGHLDVVKYLVSQGADIRADNDWAVRLASEYGHLDVVKYLVFDLPSLLRCPLNEVHKNLKKDIAATRIQRWYIKSWKRRRLLYILKITIPLYFHPERKGGYFAKKDLTDFLRDL